jgi:drug/metabolite transporter (DMT)-like permease
VRIEMAGGVVPTMKLGARPLLAIGLKMMAVTVFVGMATTIKLAGTVEAGQIVFYRSLFAVVPILVFLAFRGEIVSAVRTSRPMAHVLRGASGVASMWFGFYGLTRLPLPEQITLNYAQPLLVVAFGALFLGETVRIYRWSAVIVGFLGVVIVAWPKLTLLTGDHAVHGEEGIGALAVLAGALFSAISGLQIRQLVATEKSSTVVLWFSITSAGLALMTYPLGWTPLSSMQLTWLVLAGLAGGIGQILITEAYRHGDVSIIAPFEYTSMILGIVIGYFVFDDIPTVYTLVGGSIVVAAGLFIIFRERQVRPSRGRPRKPAPPQ